MELYFKIPFVLKDETEREVDFYELNKDGMFHVIETISDALEIIRSENDNFDEDFTVFKNRKFKSIENNLSKAILISDDFSEDDMAIYFMIDCTEEIQDTKLVDYIFYIVSELLEPAFDRIKIFDLLDENLFTDDSYDYSPYNHYCKLTFIDLVPLQIETCNYS